MNSQPKPTRLLHPMFIVSLILLLANDFIFKIEFHNTLTGKLSDFAGLFAAGVFCIECWPKRKAGVLLVLAALFFWWKSPLSQPFIDFSNQLLPIPIGRVVDYGDLMALALLPAAILVQPVALQSKLVTGIAVIAISAGSLFAFSATSMVRFLADENHIPLNKNLHTRKSEEEVIRILRQQRLEPKQLPAVYSPYYGPDLYSRSVDSARQGAYFSIDSLYPKIYVQAGKGHSWVIPRLFINRDSIHNLQFYYSGNPNGSGNIQLHSFDLDSNGPGAGLYPTSRNIGRAIKKRMKELLKSANP